MPRFLVRHFTAILVLIVLGWWGVFYLPNTPTWALLWLRAAVENRNGDEAAQYIDFQSVMQHAATDVVSDQAAKNPIGALVGQAAAQLFSQPMANLAESIAKQRVNDGDPNLRIPAGAVALSLIMLHRDGDTAWTKFTDRKGQNWELHMTRENARWQVTEVKDARVLLQKLREHEEKQFNSSP